MIRPSAGPNNAQGRPAGTLITDAKVRPTVEKTPTVTTACVASGVQARCLRAGGRKPVGRVAGGAGTGWLVRCSSFMAPSCSIEIPYPQAALPGPCDGHLAIGTQRQAA